MAAEAAVSASGPRLTSTGRCLAPGLDRLRSRLAHPGLGPLGGSAAMAGAFFCIWYLVLSPGYWINDDLKAIWALVGYPSGTAAAPFLIHSNVLLGFVLGVLYALPTNLNWAMILYAVINASSVWMLLYVLLEAQVPAGPKLMGAGIVLAGVAVPTVNLTYTVTAAISSVAGACLLLCSAARDCRPRRAKAAVGAALVLTGSLIRLEMVALVLAIALPTGICLTGFMDRRRLAGAAALTLSVIAAGYGFNRLYVRLHPAWNYFYAYDNVREQLHDAHRLSNLHNQIRRVGWTANDQELFAHWFFPDAGTYSYERIGYLVDHSSATSQDPGGTVAGFLGSLATSRIIPYLALALGLALWVAAARPDSRRLATALAAPLAALGLNLYLAWAYKDPDYVLASTLGASLALSVVALLGLPTTSLHLARLDGQGSIPARIARIIAILLVAIGASVLVEQAVANSNLNRMRASAYQVILDDLDTLRADGSLPVDALVVSPAHGLPYEWSYPFTLTRPAVAYFDTGWITFSPAYDLVLQAYGIRSLPEALLHDSRLYLMVDAGFTPLLQRYYSEHEDTAVAFVPVYAMPNTPGLPGYDDIYLFHLRPVP